MPSPEALRFLETLRSAPKMVEMDLAQQRQAGEHAEDLESAPAGVAYEPADHGEWAIPDGARDGTALLYLFGGGHVISSVHSRHRFSGHLALVTRCRVLIADYRRAPEHPYPADVEDVSAAYRALLEEGIEPGAILVAGESSAGGLCLSALLTLRDAGAPLPAGAILMSPWADLACTGASHAENRDLDLTVTTDGLRRMAGQYLPGGDMRNPLASPAHADLRGLPSLLIQVGGDEVLLDDAVTVARHAGPAGVAATLQVWPHMQHFFQIGVGVYPEAQEALDQIGAWVDRLLAPATVPRYWP